MSPHRTPILALAAIALTPLLPAQLSGTYTLDPAGSGPRNFKTFLDLNYQLLSQGISGPVILEVADGRWLGPQEVLAPQGMSTTNTITLRAKNPGKAILARTAAGGPLNVRATALASIDGMVIRDLVFEGTASLGGLVGVVGTHVTVQDCEFRDAVLRLTADHSRVIGCVAEGKDAMQLGGQGLEVSGNFVKLGRGTWGLSVTGGGLGAVRCRVYNNVVYSDEAFSGGHGIIAHRAVDVEHNTVVIHKDSKNTMAAMNISGDFVSGPRVRNNILANLNGGLAVLVRGVPTGAPVGYYAEIDNNLCHAPLSSAIWSIDGVGDYVTLAAFRFVSGQAANSILADPGFVDVDAQPAGLKVLGASPAIGAAGKTPSWVSVDFEGQTRNSPATIGAYKGPRKPTFVTFGQGCAGSGTQVPAIGYSGTLALDSKDFELRLNNALGGLTVQAFLALGVQKISFNFGGSCDLLVNPLLLLQTNVPGTGAGTGTAGFKIPLPSNPAYQGTTVHFQWGVIDPAAAGIGVATSNGATLTL